MRPTFYQSDEYRRRQSEITRRNVEKGVYRHLKRREQRTCNRENCNQAFEVRLSDPKKFCSRGCSAKVTNRARTQSVETRKKISASLQNRPTFDKEGKPRKGQKLVPRAQAVCGNSNCAKEFEFERYKARIYCSAICAIKSVGSRPTSPKASRGKSGVRRDIDQKINFHSRWEANVARMYNHLGIAWMYEPRTFKMGEHTYTPDFYLPYYNEFVEVKNFMSPYSKQRDEKFRQYYPNILLKVLLKDEYLALEELYSRSIPGWEFKR
jgi:hypothetical protein